MNNVLISGKPGSFKTTIAKSIARSMPNINGIKVYTNHSTAYVDDKNLEVVEFGNEDIYETKIININNGDLILIDEYICPFFHFPTLIDSEVLNFSVILVVRSHQDVDQPAWSLLSKNNGYRAIEVSDVLMDTVVNDNEKAKNISLFFNL